MPNDVLSFSAHLTAASSSRCKWLTTQQQQQEVADSRGASGAISVSGLPRASARHTGSKPSLALGQASPEVQVIFAALNGPKGASHLLIALIRVLLLGRCALRCYVLPEHPWDDGATLFWSLHLPGNTMVSL